MQEAVGSLNEIRETYGDNVIIRLVHVNKEPALTKRYAVEWIPLLVFIDPKGTGL